MGKGSAYYSSMLGGVVDGRLVVLLTPPTAHFGATTVLSLDSLALLYVSLLSHRGGCELDVEVASVRVRCTACLGSVGSRC